MKIKDATVLVTGANRGIGKAFVEELLEQGAEKIYLGVRDPKSVEDLLRDHPTRLRALELDVTNPEHIHRAAQEAKDVNLIINNAGVAFFGHLDDADCLDHARKEMEVNYFGPLALLRSFTPILRNNGGGAWACVSSIAGLLIFPGAPSYCSSKAAEHFLIQAARMELAGQGTHVLGIYPGPVDTDMAKDIDLPKVTPEHVARESLRALEKGEEMLLPDDYARDMYELLKRDPQKAERKMRESYEDMLKKERKAA